MIGEDYRVGTPYAFRVPLRDSAGALQTGLTPAVTIYTPDNSAESSPPSLTELGGTGVYGFVYTPSASGAYTFIVSASGCLSIVFTVQVRATERGDIYSRIGAPTGASLAADVATIDAVVDAIKAKTDNLPASPAAVGSQMTLADGAITSTKFATDAITATAIAADAIGASELAADAVADIQSGLATDMALQTVDDVVDAIRAKTDNLPTSPAAVGSAMTLTEGERASIAEAVWAATTRTLSSFGTLVSDVASAVWGAVTRTLTGLGDAAADVWTHTTGAAVATATARIPENPAAVGSEMDLVDAPNATGLDALVTALFVKDLTAAAIEAAPFTSLAGLCALLDGWHALESKKAIDGLTATITVRKANGSVWGTFVVPLTTDTSYPSGKNSAA